MESKVNIGKFVLWEDSLLCNFSGVLVLREGSSTYDGLQESLTPDIICRLAVFMIRILQESSTLFSIENYYVKKMTIFFGLLSQNVPKVYETIRLHP